MKVTFVLPGYGWVPIGGFGVVYEHANQLAARGHAVTIVHPRRLRGTRRPPARTPLRRLLRPIGDIRWALRHRFLRPSMWWHSIHPDVDMRYVAEPVAGAVPDGDAVVATAWQTADYVAALPARCGRPLYLVQDFPPYLGDSDVLGGTWRLPMTKVAVSSWLQELVEGARAHDVVTVPNGIGSHFRLTRPMEDRPLRVGMMVSYAPYKAWEDGLEALRIAKRLVPAMGASLFGPGPRPEGLEPWMQYSRNIPSEELVELMNGCAVFLCSSLKEGFALPPAEAMACGCAVATTDCGGNSDYARPGETALVSAPSDPRTLGANVARLLEDRKLRSEIAVRGHEWIAALTWERAGEAMERVLRASPGSMEAPGAASGSRAG